MAKDDMHVIIYKLLAYLYDCMKSGKEPERAMFDRDSAIFCGVPDKYRCAIVYQMSQRGYVTGFKVDYSDDRRDVIVIDPEITLDGVEYMFENSMMNRALSYLREIKSSLPFI